RLYDVVRVVLAHGGQGGREAALPDGGGCPRGPPRPSRRLGGLEGGAGPHVARGRGLRLRAASGTGGRPSGVGAPAVPQARGLRLWAGSTARGDGSARETTNAPGDRTGRPSAASGRRTRRTTGRR